MDLALSCAPAGDDTVVWVVGEVDAYTAPRLREYLGQLVESGQNRLILDIDEVDFLDSTGLGVLVGALRRVRCHAGSLQLVCSQDRLLKLFRITGLIKVFTIHEALSAAVDGPAPVPPHAADIG